MARVVYADVAAILDGSIGLGKVNVAIETATVWIDTRLVPVCTSLSTAVLTEIEKYLAAHIATLSADGADLQSAKRGDISETYRASAPGESTRYIGIAAALDPCGVIKGGWMDRKRASFYVGAGYAADA